MPSLDMDVRLDPFIELEGFCAMRLSAVPPAASVPMVERLVPMLVRGLWVVVVAAVVLSLPGARVVAGSTVLAVLWGELGIVPAAVPAVVPDPAVPGAAMPLAGAGG